MSNKLKDVKLTFTEVQLARAVFNIANGRHLDAGIESQTDVIKLEKIQEQIKECNLGRDVANSAVNCLYLLGCRQYGKNLKFDVSYRSDIRTLSIEHVGFYIDEEEGGEDFKVNYADSTTRHVRVPLDCLVTPRNMINGNVVLHETLQCELEKWLCHPFVLPNGKEVSTIASKCISIQFIDAQEGV